MHTSIIHAAHFGDLAIKLQIEIEIGASSGEFSVAHWVRGGKLKAIGHGEVRTWSTVEACMAYLV